MQMIRAQDLSQINEKHTDKNLVFSPLFIPGSISSLNAFEEL